MFDWPWVGEVRSTAVNPKSFQGNSDFVACARSSLNLVRVRKKICLGSTFVCPAFAGFAHKHQSKTHATLREPAITVRCAPLMRTFLAAEIDPVFGMRIALEVDF